MYDFALESLLEFLNRRFEVVHFLEEGGSSPFIVQLNKLPIVYIGKILRSNFELKSKMSYKGYPLKVYDLFESVWKKIYRHF